MSKKLVLARIPLAEKQCLAGALFDDNKAVGLYLGFPEKRSLLGDIYIGKVENVNRSMRAAFVRFTHDQTGYLPLREGQEPAAGSEIIVQVEKEAMKQKLPRLTDTLSFPGRFLVLCSDPSVRTFSRKLSAEERDRAGAVLRPVISDNTGFIVRTNAGSAKEEEIREEFRRLHSQMEDVLTYGRSRVC